MKTKKAIKIEPILSVHRTSPQPNFHVVSLTDLGESEKYEPKVIDYFGSFDGPEAAAKLAIDSIKLTYSRMSGKIDIQYGKGRGQHKVLVSYENSNLFAIDDLVVKTESDHL